ncbi:MAG: hypothetical protein H0V53_09275, partial [Rubrobacter sp.]|nr:hypothetical protein [Rubrobacter sp.]
MEFIRRVFGRGGGAPDGGEASILSREELERIGTPEDPLAAFEAGMERSIEAAEAEQNGDTARAVELYER